MQKRKIVIAVIGGSKCSEEIAKEAYKAGHIIAEKGAILLNGGGNGVMLASAQGAKDAGGMTLGITQSDNKEKVNPYIDVVIATGMGHVRNAIIIQSADGVLAVGGEYGTLSEVAFALNSKKPIAGVFSWNRILSEIPSFDNPKDAIDFIFEKI
ncbi:MAG: TIGR00725 family protein [Candidatus Aureabacteria bacterium]|nr:TIGR00725 family protein [Candidatus Auribacterota bacterium]